MKNLKWLLFLIAALIAILLFKSYLTLKMIKGIGFIFLITFIVIYHTRRQTFLDI